MTNERRRSRMRTNGRVLRTAVFYSGKYLRADIRAGMLAQVPERGGRIQMYHSRELSGVSIKAAHTLEQQYLEGCDKSRGRVNARTRPNKNTDGVCFFGKKKGG